MKKKLVEALMRQASLDSVIEVECPECGAPMTAEPDAREFYCEECERVVMKNPLVELGLI
jgi:endogenous inhibitor of DNA gyrase (YacG/DUF329 family)